MPALAGLTSSEVAKVVDWLVYGELMIWQKSDGFASDVSRVVGGG